MAIRIAKAPARTGRVAIPWSRRLASISPYLYLLPALLAVVIWVYRPLFETFQLSFYSWNLLPTRPKVFVGLENYIRVLTLPEMGIALRNTVYTILGVIPFSIVLPLAVTLLVQDIGGRARSYYRVLIFLPVLMAPVVVAVIWRWMMHPTQGLITLPVLAITGWDSLSWFRDPAFALPAILVITGWKLLGFNFLIFSAGLAGISKEYTEAANIDGASKWQIVRHITLPLMTPSITFVLMMTVLLSSQWVFPLLNVLTQGGPFDSTTNIYFLLWQYGFRSFAVGWSSAAAVLFFIAFGLLAWTMVRFMDRYSVYDQ